MKFVNLTPHVVRSNDGTEYAPSGTVARVASSYTPFINDVCQVIFGDVYGLPDASEGVMYVVSGMVSQATKRVDVVSPATGHPAAVRKDGQIYSVPGFVRS